MPTLSLPDVKHTRLVMTRHIIWEMSLEVTFNAELQHKYFTHYQSFQTDQNTVKLDYVVYILFKM